MLGGTDYIVTGDDDVRVMARKLSGKDSTTRRFSGIKEVKVQKLLNSKISFDKIYECNGEAISSVEITLELAVLANPTQSGLVDEILVDQDAMTSRLDKLGYKCQALVKKSQTGIKKTKKMMFKPRRQLCQRSRNKIRKEKMWVLDTLRSEHVGPINIPAVTIA